MVSDLEFLRVAPSERVFDSEVSAGRDCANTAARERVARREPWLEEVLFGWSREVLTRVAFVFGIAFLLKVKILILLRSAGKQDKDVLRTRFEL